LADKTDSDIVDEVEKRLDDLFGEGEETPEFEVDSSEIEEAPTLEEDIQDIEDTPLKELKSTVLSIDWEISDETMNRFLDQVDKLKVTYQDDKIIHMFLQLLGSVGKYIKAKKASADPDVVRLLNSAYAALEKITITKSITDEERKKLLAIEVDKFKNLKERLVAKKLTAKEDRAEASKKNSLAKAPAIPIADQAEGETKEQISVAAKEAEKPVSDDIPTPRTGEEKGLGLGNMMGLMVLAPLVIIACFNYIYICQLTSIPSLIDQTLQATLGMTIEGTKAIVFAISGCLIILIGLIAYLNGNKTSAKIKSLTDVIEKMAAGKTDVDIDVKADGEIGALADDMARMRNKIR
jgi:methyl-accepting chemotaxis protein